MPQVCKVCYHEKRFEIEREIAKGVPKQRIANRFGLSYGSVRRHDDSHLSPGIREAVERENLANHGSCQSIQRKIVGRAMEAVEEARGVDQINRSVQAATSANHVLGKTTGEVQSDKINLLFMQLGVKDESELKSLADMKRAAESMTLEQCMEDGCRLLLFVLKERPEWGDDLRARLFGKALTDGGSFAVVEESGAGAG